MVQLQLDKYIAEKKIAHELVKKWWMIDDAGSFGTGLVVEIYPKPINGDVPIAGTSGTGGVDQFNKLINNTFVVFTRLYYVSNEVAAEVIRQVAYGVADELGGGLPTQLARKAADKIYEKTS